MSLQHTFLLPALLTVTLHAALPPPPTTLFQFLSHPQETFFLALSCKEEVVNTRKINKDKVTPQWCAQLPGITVDVYIPWHSWSDFPLLKLHTVKKKSSGTRHQSAQSTRLQHSKQVSVLGRESPEQKSAEMSRNVNAMTQ